MPTYIPHLLDEDISDYDNNRLGAETLFTSTPSAISHGLECTLPAENEIEGGVASPETTQPSDEFSPSTEWARPPAGQLSRGTRRTDTAPGESRSASEGAHVHFAVYRLHIGPRSYRLRPDSERPDSVFATLPEIEGPDAYLLMLPVTELPLQCVYLLPATEARRSRVVLRPSIERPLSSPVEIKLEREDIHTGGAQSVDISVGRYSIGTDKTMIVGSIRLGLEYV